MVRAEGSRPRGRGFESRCILFHCKEKEITLGQTQTNNINKMITIVNQVQFDSSNQMIQFSVIPLSGTHCIRYYIFAEMYLKKFFIFIFFRSDDERRHSDGCDERTQYCSDSASSKQTIFLRRTKATRTGKTANVTFAWENCLIDTETSFWSGLTWIKLRISSLVTSCS